MIKLKHLLWVLLVVSLLLYISFLSLSPSPSSIKVAFIGDTTVDSPIFSFLVREKVDLIVHQGDLTYLENPESKFCILLEKLSEERPILFLSVPGNKDIQKWKFYAEAMEKHNTKQSGPFQVHCEGEIGVQSFCRIGFLLVIQLVTEENSKNTLKTTGYMKNNIPNEDFIHSSISAGDQGDTPFRVCSFHHPQELYRLQKPITDKVDLIEYETCRKHSALVVTGHDHLYVRTYPMSNFKDGTTTKNGDYFVLDGKVTVAVVSGLGGMSVDEAVVGGVEREWWAAVWPKNPVSVKDPTEEVIGALLCDFQRNLKKANCLYKTVDGNVHDKFSFVTE